MKRTLMYKNRELLDFEVEPLTGKARVLDTPGKSDVVLAEFGLCGPNPDLILTKLIRARCISRNRKDLPKILSAFGARSPSELALMGHGVSLADHIWYRAPASTERWENVNFIDNEWDSSFCISLLLDDYSTLTSCTPDIPDITTSGHLRKAWEQNGDSICLLKEPIRKDGADLEGALLGAKLCALIFGESSYQPMEIVERNGKRLSSCPLIVSRNEELMQGFRLFMLCGFTPQKTAELMGTPSPQDYINIFSRAGASGVSTHIAKMHAFKDLSLLADFHAGNYGVICNHETGERRIAPPFDYDHSFGFPSEDIRLEIFCNEPRFAALACAKHFSDLDESWDWSWYDSQVLNGFEDRIIEAYTPYHNLPPNFGELLAHLFIIQREYVNEIALEH